MSKRKTKNVAVIVAHPDDETLWAGGTILSHPSWKCYVLSLCRGSDEDRAPRFFQALEALKAKGCMADLDDSPEQKPLDEEDIEHSILEALPPQYFDLIITHSPIGEYTRHIRHEEVGKAVINMWHKGEISATELYVFAYEDSNKKYLPKPIESANIFTKLTKHIWLQKHKIITEIYGFEIGSFEAETAPVSEAFWHFSSPHLAQKWMRTVSI
jgi:LmbE family N-acetylglucosaminyl deacetylase